MPNLSLQTFTSLVGNMSASAQGAATTAFAATGNLLDITVGSVTRAIFESGASIALWLQYQSLQLLQAMRLATAVGADVDSFVGDFQLTRLPGIASTAQLTVSSLSPANQSATIPVGVQLGRLADGSLTWVSYADTTNPAWNGSAYVRPAGTPSIVVPAQCSTVGSVGNVQPGTINLLGTQIAGIDVVTNANSATGGLDAETDASLKARFAAYINSRSGATEQAVEAAIEGVQQGLDYLILPGQATDGSSRPGWFAVLIDDGSGHPPAALLQSVYNAIEPIRALGIQFAVAAPGVVVANVVAAITVAAGSSNGQAQNAAATAISAYLTGLGIGATASYAQISAAIVLAGTGITGVASLTVNSGAANVVPSTIQVVRPGNIVVTASGGTTP